MGVLQDNLVLSTELIKPNYPILNTCLNLIMLPWQRHIRQLNYENLEVCVVNLLPAIFGDQGFEGFREKGKLNRRIQNCVKPPLKEMLPASANIINQRR